MNRANYPKRDRFMRAVKKTSGLVGYWPFNDANATALNYAPASPNTNNGTPTDVVSGTNIGKLGRSYTFNNSSSGIVFTGFTIPVTAISVGIIMQLNGNQATSDILASCTDGANLDGFQITFTGTLVDRWTVYNNVAAQAAISSGTLVNATNYFQVGVYKSNDAEFYQNGASLGTDTSVTMTATAGTLTVGKNSSAASNYFTGYVSHFFVCNRRLETSEVINLSHKAGFI